MNLGEHRGDGIRHSMHLSAPNGGLAQMLRDPDGQWVPYSDYAALQAENKRIGKLFADTERMILLDGEFEAAKVGTYAALQAEVERLRKERDKLDFKESCEYKRREGWENACNEARAEVERLKGMNISLMSEKERYRLASLRGDVAQCENAHLKAENERLRKAVDAMAWALMGNPTVEAWNAAKGVQP